MKYLNHGSGRVVLVNDDYSYVIKVPINYNGIKQNKTEYESFCADKAYKGEIIFYKDNIIKMEYIEHNKEQLYATLLNDFICTLWDQKTDKTLKITCDLNCNNCIYQLNPDKRYIKALEIVHKYKNLQVGFDKNNNVKMYDYGIPDDSDFKLDFKPELFMEYWNKGLYYQGILFTDWAKLTTQSIDNTEELKTANAFKRRSKTQKAS